MFMVLAIVCWLVILAKAKQGTRWEEGRTIQIFTSLGPVLQFAIDLFSLMEHNMSLDAQPVGQTTPPNLSVLRLEKVPWNLTPIRTATAEEFKSTVSDQWAFERRKSDTTSRYLSGISKLVQWLAPEKVYHLTFGILEK